MVMGLAIIMFIIMIFFFSSILQFGPSSRIPQNQLNLDLNVNRLLVISLAVLLVTTIAFAVAYTVARKTTLPVVIWLDDRLLPLIKKLHSYLEKPKTEAPLQNFWLGDPELKFAPTMATETEFGTFTTVWGEVILHQNPFFPGWKPVTLWSHFWTVLKTSLAMTIFISVLLTMGINFLTSGLSFVSLFLSVTYFGIMLYLAREWLRYAEFTVVTSERYIQAFGKFSWSGFFFNRGYDVNLRHNYTTRIDDVDSAVTPKAFGIPVSWLYGFFLKRWAETDSRIGSVLVRRVAQGGHDLFLNYNFAPLLKDLLTQGKGLSAATARDLSDIMQRKRDYIRGKPGEKTNREQRIREADEWAAKEIALMGYQPPQTFDVFEFKRNYLLKLAGRTPPPPTTTQPTQSTPSAFPGVAEDELNSNTDSTPPTTLYEDPIL